MKVKLKAAVYFLSDIKGQRVAHIAQVTCFEDIVRIRRLIYPNLFFARHVVEMIVLPQGVVSLGEAMYQSAFLSLEFRLNSELVTSATSTNLKNRSAMRTWVLCLNLFLFVGMLFSAISIRELNCYK